MKLSYEDLQAIIARWRAYRPENCNAHECADELEAALAQELYQIENGRKVTCSCTKFTNPAATIRGKHPSPDCPCTACFLGSGS